MAASKTPRTRKKSVKKTVKKKSPARTKSVKNSVKKKTTRTNNAPRVKKAVKKKSVKKKAAPRVKVGHKPKQEHWTVNGKKLSIEQLKTDFCEKIAGSSMGIKKICEANPGYPSHDMFRRWLRDDATFVGRYARAREEQADTMAEEILDIADDTQHDTYVDERSGIEKTNHEVINRSRLKVETRWKLMQKLKPKVYGDKLDLNVTERRIEMTPEQFAAWKRNFG